MFYPQFQDTYDAALAEGREALGEATFARCFAEGQAMTLDEAVEYALQDEAQA